jgi:ribosomal protein S18 acetylase RimI-like enzyme
MFWLNPASPADQDFIFDAFKASMKSYVEWAWGWDEEAQRKGLLSEKNLEGFQLVMLGNDRAGALLLEKHADHHYLRTIFLLPEHHRQGIGSLVMQSLQRDAQMACKPLRLRVIHTNPAQKLYARLGFTVMEQDEKTLLMQWQAAAS